jgi:outer membrane protein TolC
MLTMFKHLTLALAVAACTATAAAAQKLTLEEAIAIGLDNNRTLANAVLNVEKADHDIADAKTRRLPSFKIEAQASQLLRPIDVHFNRGAFGDLPGVGPVPNEDVTMRTPARLSLVVDAQASQPITQLIKVNLNVRLTEAAREYQREQVRDVRVTLVNQIRRTYYGIVQTRSALDANRQTLALLHELNRVVTTRVAQQVALKADGLTVESRIAQADLQQVTLRHTLASQKEQLNQLIGRDVQTPFDVIDVPEITIAEVDLAVAQGRAKDSRPDVKQARIKLQQAELARRVAKADYVPDLGLAVTYLSPINIDGAPRQIATAAIQASWEPFDWGRKGRAVATKDLEIRQARNSVRDAEDRAVLEVNSKFRGLEAARAQLRAARLNQDVARENVRVRTTQYDVKAALLADVLQTQSSLAASDNEYQQAMVAFWTARADFERALGEDSAQ